MDNINTNPINSSIPPSSITEEKSNNSKKIIIPLIIVFLLILLSSIFVYLIRINRNAVTVKKASEIITASPTITNIITVIPTLISRKNTVQNRGSSMNPNLIYNAYYSIDRNWYKTKLPERGDVIHIHVSEVTDTTKRIIGLPDETLKITGGKVYINGTILEEPYLSSDIVTNILPGEAFITNDQSITLPKNSYFVLGDNRDYSSDSREWGFVTMEMIEGKIMECVLNCPGKPKCEMGECPYFDKS